MAQKYPHELASALARLSKAELVCMLLDIALVHLWPGGESTHDQGADTLDEIAHEFHDRKLSPDTMDR